MTISFPPILLEAFFALVACAVFVVAAVALSGRGANPNKAPVLISDSTSTRAIALESITLRPSRSLTASVKFGNDSRTRYLHLRAEP